MMKQNMNDIMSGNHLSRRASEILMFIVVALRSTSLLFSTVCLEVMEPFMLLGIRFTIAFILLSILFRKKLFGAKPGTDYSEDSGKHGAEINHSAENSKLITGIRHSDDSRMGSDRVSDRTGSGKVSGISMRTLLHGVIIGVLFFAVMVFETIGLVMTNTSTVSFLENTAIIFVPIFEAVLIRRLPKHPAIVSAVMAITGVGFLVLRNGHIAFTKGELICLATAIIYAITIIATGRFSKEDDALQIGIIQVGVIGILGLAAAAVNGTLYFPTDPKVWGSLIFLVIVCTGFGFTLQPVAQQGISTETAGLFCAFNPLITSILGYIFLSERFTANKVVGAALIIGSIVASSLLDKLMLNKRVQMSNSHIN